MSLRATASALSQRPPPFGIHGQTESQDLDQTEERRRPGRVPAERSRAAPPPPRSRCCGENIKSLAGAVLIYLVVKTLFVEAFRIPSGSMIPTLLIGDWLFVNKLVYGPTIPFTNAHLPGYANPKHQDVVVFVSPYQADNGDDPTPTLVKRLIGMPGDTLYMRDGRALSERPRAATGVRGEQLEGRSATR